MLRRTRRRGGGNITVRETAPLRVRVNGEPSIGGNPQVERKTKKEDLLGNIRQSKLLFASDKKNRTKEISSPSKRIPRTEKRHRRPQATAINLLYASGQRGPAGGDVGKRKRAHGQVSLGSPSEKAVIIVGHNKKRRNRDHKKRSWEEWGKKPGFTTLDGGRTPSADYGTTGRAF